MNILSDHQGILSEYLKIYIAYRPYYKKEYLGERQ